MKASPIHNVTDLRSGLLHPRTLYGTAISPRRSAIFVRNIAHSAHKHDYDIARMNEYNARPARAIDLRLGVQSTTPRGDRRALKNETENFKDTCHMRKHYPQSERAWRHWALHWAVHFGPIDPKGSLLALAFRAVPYLNRK